MAASPANRPTDPDAQGPVEARTGHRTAQERRKKPPLMPGEWAGLVTELLRLVKDVTTPRGGLYRRGLIERAEAAINPDPGLKTPLIHGDGRAMALHALLPDRNVLPVILANPDDFHRLPFSIRDRVDRVTTALMAVDQASRQQALEVHGELLDELDGYLEDAEDIKDSPGGGGPLPNQAMDLRRRLREARGVRS
jgi:hypothetical protein